MNTWQKLMEMVEANHGIVVHADLVAAGVSPRQIGRWRDAGRLVDVHRGVYRIAGSPPTYESRLAAALRDPGPDALGWGSFCTAGRILGMRVAPRDDRIEITRPYGVGASRCGVIVHRSTCIPRHHTTVVAGLQIMTAPRTAFDLSGRLRPQELERLITHAIQTRDIVCSLPALYGVLYDLGGRGRPGTRRFRADLDARRLDEPPTESVLDQIGRALLRDVPGIEWQVEMSDEQGYIRRLDGLVRPALVAVEFDSIFHDDPRQRALDVAGDRRLLDAHGIVTRRLRWGDLTRRGDLTLAEILHATGAQPI